jgi:hypothetical protein
MGDVVEVEVETVGKVDAVKVVAGQFPYIEVNFLAVLRKPGLVETLENGSATLKDVSCT